MGIGCIIAYMFEPPVRHIQLLGFMLPKALGILSDILERRRKYKARSWHNVAIFLLAWALIAYSQLREKHKKKLTAAHNKENSVDVEYKESRVVNSIISDLCSQRRPLNPASQIHSILLSVI